MLCNFLKTSYCFRAPLFKFHFPSLSLISECTFFKSTQLFSLIFLISHTSYAWLFMDGCWQVLSLQHFFKSWTQHQPRPPPKGWQRGGNPSPQTTKRLCAILRNTRTWSYFPAANSARPNGLNRHRTGGRDWSEAELGVAMGGFRVPNFIFLICCFRISRLCGQGFGIVVHWKTLEGATGTGVGQYWSQIKRTNERTN